VGTEWVSLLLDDQRIQAISQETWQNSEPIMPSGVIARAPSIKAQRTPTTTAAWRRSSSLRVAWKSCYVS